MNDGVVGERKKEKVGCEEGEESEKVFTCRITSQYLPAAHQPGRTAGLACALCLIQHGKAMQQSGPTGVVFPSCPSSFIQDVSTQQFDPGTSSCRSCHGSHPYSIHPCQTLANSTLATLQTLSCCKAVPCRPSSTNVGSSQGH